MALRKASAYSKKYARPFTRKSKKKNLAYIRTVPYSKIARFNFGNQKAHTDGKYKFQVNLVANEQTQIRDTAIEAARMYIHKMLEVNAPGEYFLMVKVHPHHFLRDNKTAAGAGADRTSTGMSHSYGIVVGRAALVQKGKSIIFVSTLTEKAARAARDAMNEVKAKVPCAAKVTFEQIK